MLDLSSENTQTLTPGLYLVATPIGNLEDITLRALRVLKSCHRILAEDTRHSRILLDHFGIRKPLEPYHDFNKERSTAKYLEYLKNDEVVALICDAGTPGIADPAFNLVKAALEANLPVIPIPGPSALLAALIASGMPTDRFLFENFPPKKSAQRRHKLEAIKERWTEKDNHVPTLCFFVTPYNLGAFLQEISNVFGPETHIVLARELTKKFEEFKRGPASELATFYATHVPRGEFVLLFHPQNKR